ncbi:MAG: cbb3-type cytochrome c oxidase subunit I [Candidatus Hydrogenedentes bacterium]|nr:cbb3-type cytochrome c oxidase subunit I [Candidatus Hydrogenedentota bacterium]
MTSHSPSLPSKAERNPAAFSFRAALVSTDHKVIGILYGVTALTFLLTGFLIMMLMRWQLAYPGRALPGASALFGSNSARMPGGVMVPEFYYQLGAMHGTIMVFLAIVPLLVGAFGTYLVPLQLGAPNTAFPRLTRLGYWSYLAGGVVWLSSFALPGGAAQSGWTSYPPLSIIAGHGQTFWLIGMILIIVSSIAGAINMIVTIIQLRVIGLTYMRLPFFVWSQLVTAFLLLLAFPPLGAAGILQLMDRVVDTSFFLPSGLVVSGAALTANVGGQTIPRGGGSALLWQHLFWFLAHPEVYVLVLPAMGMVAEILANNARKPLWGYKSMVYGTIFLGVMSMLVWAHHMFLTGMGTVITAFFQATTMIVSIPSIIVLTALLASLWGGAIRFNTPMLFALAFLPMFGIGGLTGLPLGLAVTDIHLHDTYYVIDHFHYIVVCGTLSAIFGGIYYWFPKVTGRAMNERLGRIHFWSSLVLLNCIFMPMFIQGMAGVSRRLYDGGLSYAHAQPVLKLNVFITHAAFALALAQIPFIVNLLWSLRRGPRVEANPWQATTLEWAAASPPLAQGNFETPPVAHRGPCEYSVPGKDKDYTPQWEQ